MSSRGVVWRILSVTGGKTVIVFFKSLNEMSFFENL